MVMNTIKFLSIRKSTTIMSIILIVISGFSLMTKGLNLGIDFTGGIQIEISFETAPDIKNVRNNLASGGYDDAIVQNSGSSQDLMVRIPPRNGSDFHKRRILARHAKVCQVALQSKLSCHKNDIIRIA